MDRPVSAAFYNMCMIYDKDNDLVLVQDKVIDEKDGWGGLTFPGGHLEPGESVVASVVREVREETGLTVENLRHAGMIDYWNNETGLRWLCFLYKTCDFRGDLLKGTKEGPVFWLSLSEMRQRKMAPHMEQYLTLFTNESAQEAYAEFNSRHTDELRIII